MRIALDAMGGDRGSEMAIQGALAAVRQRNDLHVILVGPQNLLEQQLADNSSGFHEVIDRITVHHASEVITMADSPV